MTELVTRQNRLQAPALALGALLGLSTILGVHVRRETRRLILESPRITIRGPLNGPTTLRVLQISDLHLDKRTHVSERLVEQVERLRYDLALVTGDIADDRVGQERALELFRRLQAPLGCYAVPGNHDHFRYTILDSLYKTLSRPILGHRRKGIHVSLEAFADEMGLAGVRMLRNESVRLPLPQGDLWLLGLDDEHSGFDDLESTLAHVPSDACKVLFTHCPDAFVSAANAGIPLVIAGHTHGGQVVLPLIGAPQTHSKLKLKRPAGLFRFGESQLYINRGVGSSIPLRFAAPPELALIELHIEPQGLGSLSRPDL